jgi:hypothetical protein
MILAGPRHTKADTDRSHICRGTVWIQLHHCFDSTSPKLPAMKRWLFSACACATVCAARNITSDIIRSAKVDGIDLFSVPFAAEALSSIQVIYDDRPVDIPDAIGNATIVDVHAHIVPSFYRNVVPFTGQSPTPNWTLEAHLGFMANNSISHSVLSISSPGSVLYPGSEEKSVALARLLNEYLAAVRDEHAASELSNAGPAHPQVSETVLLLRSDAAAVHSCCVSMLSGVYRVLVG